MPEIEILVVIYSRI